MGRPDLSDTLVHFTGPRDDYEAAYATLSTILSESRLAGSAKFIRGGHACVCFTETPANALKAGLVNAKEYSRYAPFGIMLDKAYVFSRGGRPVIYQSYDEYDLLPDGLQWRHVLFDPTQDPPIDFTWEREWRLPLSELRLNTQEASVVLPNDAWGKRLVGAWDDHQDAVVRQYSGLLGSDIAEQYREPFPWHIVLLL